MLAPRRGCLGYSKVYRKLVVSMESKQANYVLHILFTDSKFSIHLPYNSIDLLPAICKNQGICTRRYQ